MNAVTLQWITVLFIISLHSSCISAGWSKWGEFSPCSRSCGGGAKYRERLCVVDRVDRDVCKGKRINYKLCNIQDCDGPVRDFRLAQCEEYNGVPLDGEIYKWKPYYGHGETCQLLCYAEGYEFYHKLADKVIDGTSCKRSNDRICIQGKCMSVGCDTKIGSTRKTDECGVCGGDNSTCAPREDVSGLFDGELSPGYTTLVEIPAGSTDIVIKELGENENSIVLWDSQGDNLAIDSETRPLLPAVEFTGTKFIYTPENPRNMYGTLQAVGPTDLDITVYAVSQDGANPGISYKFTLPRGLHSSHSKDHTLPYNTNSAIDESNNQNQSKSRDQKPEVQANSKPSNIQISASRVPKHRNSYWKNAVNGVRRRHREKTDAKTKTVKNTQDFEEKQNTKQFVYTNGVQVLGGEKTIQNNVFVDEILYKPDEKEAKWVPSQTTQSFRNSVQELRNADERSDGFTSRRELEGLRPETQEILQSDQRYMWSFGGWTHCDVQCGNGVQRRIVSCVDREERKTVSQQLCPIESRPINAQRCYKGECGPDSPDTYVRWQTGGWSKCSRTCNLGEQKQEVYCEAVMADSTARRVEEQQCLDVYKLKPEYMRSCNEDVTCDGGQEELFTWITSPWGPCSVTCGRGFQRRQVHCASNMEDDRRRDEFYCDQEPRPRDTQRCQTSACVQVEPSTARPRPHPRSCQRSYYGCCPDGVTAARGSRFEGCPSYQPPTTTTTQRPVVSPTTTRRLSPDRSNDCHQMYYGCCPDGETPARGWQLEGCPTTHEERPSRDCRRSQYGCCPDGRTPAQGWTLEGCPSVEVRSTARPMPPERIKCWQTHYGCCPDGETPARGRNYEGCENRRSGVFQVNQGDTVVILCASLTSDDLGRTYLVEWRKEGQDKSVIVQYSNAEPQLPNSYYAGRVRVVDDISLQLSGARLEDAGLYTCAVRTSLQKREDSQLYTRTAYLDVNIAATAKPEIVTNRGSLNGFPRFTQQPKSMTIKAGSTAQLSCAARGQPEPTISWLKDGSADFLAARERRMHASSDGDLFYIMDVKPADQGIYSCLASNEIGMIAADAMLSVLQNIVISDDDANNFVPRPAPSNTVSDQCRQPSERGPGTNYVVMWYYDHANARCDRFWYGGEGGNGNRFANEDECVSTCKNPTSTKSDEDVCSLPSVTGRCRARLYRWYYNKDRKECLQFVYGGCDGNANNFKSQEDCQRECLSGTSALGDEPTCRRTTYGCCPDQKTAATGNNYEGCPSLCSGTTYGCCDDDQTPAQGPNQEGCEMIEISSGDGADCDMSDHGCCPDGVTEAKGPNGAGCDDDTGIDVDGENTDGTDIDIEIPAQCKFSKETGPCREDLKVMWYYDVQSARCQQFWYGCQGNANRFKSEKECLTTCQRVVKETETPEVAVCDQPKEIGPCRGALPRYFYNRRTGNCEFFQYGGCRGNNNNFQTVEECEQRCNGRVLTPEEICRQPSETGPCRALITKYYYNHETRLCEAFNYGGCGGNRNKFDTITECQNYCGADIPIRPVTRPTPRDRQSVCEYNSDFGPCDRVVTKYAYNIQTLQCEPFSYGGCLGNLNNFQSEEKCLQYCGLRQQRSRIEDCRLPSERGPCRGDIERWFYDSRTGSCKEFSYGGCQGNINNFATETECLYVCSDAQVEPVTPRPPVRTPAPPTQDEDICNLPLRTPCDNGTPGPYWYYNTGEGECREVPNGECNNNRNSFTSKEQCEGYCGRESVCKPLTYSSDIRCLAYMERFTYNEDTNECEQFVYGGCGGTANNFDTKAACDRKCKRDVTVVTEKPDTSTPAEICALPENSGNCLAYLRNWRYDSLTGQCVQFIYGGCGGNENNFKTKEACERFCTRQVVCQEFEEPLIGCFAYIPRWRYDPSTRSCENFVYGGCGGNANNFQSSEACEGKCVASTTPVDEDKEQVTRRVSTWTEICNMQADVGPCKSYVQKYHYNSLSQQCETFQYGGCLGNSNNFESREQCLMYCDSSRWAPGPARTTTPDPDMTTEGSGEITTDAPVTGVAVCALESETGVCRAFIRMWYYDFRSGQCQQFTYGGCGGNENRFQSQEECERQCSPREVCVLPRRTGVCLANIPRFYFDYAAQDCFEFVYGGCDGNANSFETKDQCLRRCDPLINRRPATTVSPVPAQKSGYCPPRVDMAGLLYACPPSCREDQDCGGKQKCCNHGCGDKCVDPVDVEPYQMNPPVRVLANAVSPDTIHLNWQDPSLGNDQMIRDNRYYTIKYYSYNQGGVTYRNVTDLRAHINTLSPDTEYHFLVRVNDPPYLSEWSEETMNKTRSHSGYDVCSLAKDPGSCDDWEVRWYYNKDSSECERFWFGGCDQGNENNFDNELACENRCKGFVVTTTEAPVPYSCRRTVFGCCSDGYTTKVDSAGSNCEVEMKPGSCPALQTDSMGICVEECQEDRDCDGVKKCCSNGCGNVCVPPAGYNVCTLPKDPGSCTDWEVRWYYNTSIEQCERFWYGGCNQGNENNFKNELACKSRCGTPEGPVYTPRPPFSCRRSIYGCCKDAYTAKIDSDGTNCEEYVNPTDEVIVPATPGESATLTCRYSANVTWYKDGKLVVNDERRRVGSDGTLEVYAATYEDDGLYACHVTRGNRPVIYKYFLQVQIPIGILPGPEKIMVKPGRQAFIHCEVYGNPKPSVSWRKGSQYLTSGGRYEMFSNGTLLIRSASEMDIDSYTCTADNRVSQVVDRTIKLELREMLVARIENDNGRVMEGGRIRLTCEGRGYPVPTVTWEKNGRPLVTGDRVVVSSDGLLTIRDVTSAETGQYSCIVANSEEKIETSTSVQVVPKVMPDDKCEDKTALMKCRLIVRARLCGYRMYSKICCNTCRQSYNARRRR